MHRLMTDKAIKQTETDTADTDTATEPKADTVKKEKKKSSAIDELKSKLEEKEREAARQMDEFRKYANESLIMELLTVVDNLERAIQSSHDDENSNAGVVAGVQMTLNEILKILDKFGVKPIDSLEQIFDPAFHQAVMQAEASDFPAKTVIEELQKGYLLHDRLLRPAMVVVSK
jgi:molecular chaperone GrpE